MQNRQEVVVVVAAVAVAVVVVVVDRRQMQRKMGALVSRIPLRRFVQKERVVVVVETGVLRRERGWTEEQGRRCQREMGWWKQV